MEAAAKNLFSPQPPTSSIQHRNCRSSSSSSSSSGPAVTLVPTTSVARQFPTSVLSQEQRDEYRPLLRLLKEDKIPQEGKSSSDLDQLVQNFERQLLHMPGLWNLLSPLQTGENASSLLIMQSVASDTKPIVEAEPSYAISLANKALSVSRQAASLAEDYKLTEAGLDNLVSTSPRSPTSPSLPIEEVKIVRSTRLLERRSKKRKVAKPNVEDHEASGSRRVDVKKNINEGFDPNDPLRLFLWGPETRELLNFEEESALIARMQDSIKLEKVKSRLQSQSGCEPTMVEWAEAVGLSCQVLRSQLHSGKISREKLINANLRLVVHIAKKYQGRGLNFQDLLQEGSRGLMKSLEKFKPQIGCRFATYAYWWIRQTIRKAIFQHSRTIRVPENLYTLWSKVMEAQKSYVQEGNHDPTKEELARRVGITVDKLDKLIFASRIPLSMQQTVWPGQDTTYEEVNADMEVEVPNVLVAKQLMRRHVRSLLRNLNPRENQIIRLRFGIGDGKPKSLSEISNMFGLSKERVRQLESRALYKLKQCLESEGLDAYADLIV